MERWCGRTAVVTGASAGIGAAIVYQLIDAGVNVVGLARRVEKIQVAVNEARDEAASRGRQSIGKTSSPGELHCVKCDVSKEEDILQAFKWIKENLGRIDILVNNAGRGGEVGPTETNTAEWKDILNTNVLGLSICTREAIQLMREFKIDDGYVIHISSVAGHIYHPVKGTQMYCASKHAVRILTEGLRRELVAAKSKIRVTEVSPGLVKTEFPDRLKSRDLKTWFLQPHIFAEDVADSVLYVLSTPPHVQIHELIIKPNGEAF